MLLSMLNSHPQVFAKGEIFQKLRDRDIKHVISRLFFSRHPRKYKAVGFKIFYYHPLDDESGMIWEDLTRDRNLIVIHLMRRNLLRTEVSRKIAGKVDVWKVEQGNSHLPLKERKVEFTVSELEEAFNRTRSYERGFGELFKSHKVVEVFYEDLVDNRASEYGRILHALEIEYIEPETSTKKQNPENLSDLVDNYSSLKAEFASSEWADFFSDKSQGNLLHDLE
jgi:hypothetical protein